MTIIAVFREKALSGLGPHLSGCTFDIKADDDVNKSKESSRNTDRVALPLPIIQSSDGFVMNLSVSGCDG